MAQHFLLSAASRTFSLRDITEISESKAKTFLRKLRWADTHGHPVCPRCGSTEHYDLSTRDVWKCKHCYKQFSVTSGTIFASHKLACKDIVLAIAIFSNTAKGLNAIEFSKDLKVQYKTAFVLLHKFREALMETRNESPMDGVCEMDGAYVNGYMRPANNIEDRVDRRLVENQNPNKRCVMVVRQLGDGIVNVGSVRTMTYITRGETVAAISSIASQIIVRGSTIHTDEASGYDPLHGQYVMMRVNHSAEYLSKKGACSNQAESFFSRFRKMLYGIHHKMSVKYLSNYANEAAYREDNRRKANGYILKDIAMRCMISEQSNEWAGYWQGNHRITERLLVA